MRKMRAIFLACILTMVMFLPVDVQASHPARLVDQADLLATAEEMQVTKILDSCSEKWDFDIVVVTTNTTDGKSVRDYADDFFDYNGYGMGENYDGVLLLVNMQTREWYISTTGYGIKAISDGDIEYIGEEVAYYLSAGSYANAFVEFADLVEKEVARARDRETLDTGEILLRIPIGLLIGAGFAFIPVTVMKKKMDNVSARREATEYMNRDLFFLNEQRDIFLYRTVNRRLKPKESSSSHIGSSGRSHGGGGGRF